MAYTDLTAQEKKDIHKKQSRLVNRLLFITPKIDPLSENTRRERRNLILISFLPWLIGALGGEIHNLSFFGLKYGALNTPSISMILLPILIIFVIIYQRHNYLSSYNLDEGHGYIKELQDLLSVINLGLDSENNGQALSAFRLTDVTQKEAWRSNGRENYRAIIEQSYQLSNQHSIQKGGKNVSQEIAHYKEDLLNKKSIFNKKFKIAQKRSDTLDKKFPIFFSVSGLGVAGILLILNTYNYFTYSSTTLLKCATPQATSEQAAIGLGVTHMPVPQTIEKVLEGVRAQQEKG